MFTEGLTLKLCGTQKEKAITHLIIFLQKPKKKDWKKIKMLKFNATQDTKDKAHSI